MFSGCYKVVSNVDEDYFVSHNITNSDVRYIKRGCYELTKAVKYEIGKTSRPEGNSKLFCFLKKEDAIAYASEYWGRDKSVLFCESTGLVEYPLSSVPMFDGYSLERLWKNIRDFSVDFLSRPTPKGTYIADSITPRKIICTFYN